MPQSRPGAPAALRAVNRALAALILVLLIATVAILVFPVSLQIFSRYTTLIPAYIWTEELARFCLVYAVMLGAMLAVREGTHFTVDVFPRLSPRGEARVELLSGSFVLLFAVVFLWWGWEFTERAAMKRLVDPVMAAYARDIEAEGILSKINALPS